MHTGSISKQRVLLGESNLITLKICSASTSCKYYFVHISEQSKAKLRYAVVHKCTMRMHYYYGMHSTK